MGGYPRRGDSSFTGNSFRCYPVLFSFQTKIRSTDMRRGEEMRRTQGVNAVQDGTWCEIKTSCCVFIAGQKEVGWNSKSLSAENGPSLFRVTQRDTWGTPLCLLHPPIISSARDFHLHLDWWFALSCISVFSLHVFVPCDFTVHLLHCSFNSNN